MEKQNAIERPNLNKATQTQGKRRKNNAIYMKDYAFEASNCRNGYCHQSNNVSI
jgi:hypothetical protein